MARPFRFGVVASTTQTQQAWSLLPRQVEDLGYTTLLIPDTMSLELAPLTALAVAAATTISLRVGSFVFCNDYRNPAILAKEVATLDLLSEGRFELGIGTGVVPADYQKMGISFDTTSARTNRLAEALYIMKRLFTEDTINFSGIYYKLTDIKGTPTPFHKPYPPIHMIGIDKDILTLAAKEANIIGIEQKKTSQGIDPSDSSLEQKIAWIQEAAAERFSDLELSHTAFDIWPNDGPTKILLGGHTRFKRMSTNEVVNYLLEQREQFGFSYIQVLDGQMEIFAPVVAQLTGN